MAHSRLSLLALVVAAVALGVALLGPDRSREVESATPIQDGAPPELEERVATLEGLLAERVERSPANGESLPQREATGTSEERLTTGADERSGSPLQTGLEEFEQRLERLEARAWTLAELEERGFRVLRLALDEDALREWCGIASDAGAAATERIEALRRLRGQFLDDGTDARLAVVASALELAGTTDDPAVRAGVWQHLSGLKVPEMRAPLLSALGRDTSPEVRARAAEALGAFMPDPEIESALLRSLDFDGDESVKDAAFLGAYGQPRGPQR